jgi:hypothetical protein
MMRFVIAIIVSLLVFVYLMMIKVKGYSAAHATSRHVEVEESWPQRAPHAHPPGGPAIIPLPGEKNPGPAFQRTQNSSKLRVKGGGDQRLRY